MNCIFCNLPAERITCENELAIAIFDKFPVSPGHMLIISRRHIATFFEATGEETVAMAALLHTCREIIDAQHHPDGYNIGINSGSAAGQTVMHLHVHLIPRYSGDVKDPRGGVRGVIPEKRGY
jgi:diadenosine tetraphosphate (Ap4A) HIT family hydrolase